MKTISRTNNVTAGKIEIGDKIDYSIAAKGLYGYYSDYKVIAIRKTAKRIEFLVEGTFVDSKGVETPSKHYTGLQAPTTLFFR